MKTSKIIKKIDLAYKALGVADSKLNDVLTEILPFLDFESPAGEFEPDFFHVENTTDGINLSDNWTNIYNITDLLRYIENNGSIKSYEDLKQFSI